MKHSSPLASTDEGRTIDVNEGQYENVERPILTTSESSGNGEWASLAHESKEPAPIVLMVEGRMIASRKGQPANARSGMDSNREPGQNETDTSD
jgi:hypothetical protein